MSETGQVGDPVWEPPTYSGVGALTFPQCDHDEFPTLDACEAIFREAPAALALISAAPPRVVMANTAFFEILGARRGQETRRLDQAFRGAAADQVSRAIELCLSGAGPARLRIVHAHGADLMRLHVELRRIELDSEPYALVAVSQPDKALTLSELGEAGVLAEFGALSRGLVYIHDVPAERLRHGRHPLAERLGLTGAPLELSHIREMVHPDDLEPWSTYAADQVKVTDERVSRGTFRMMGSAGDWLFVNIRSRVFARDDDGKVTRVIGVATDVTDVHTHAQAMADAASALAHSELAERRRIGRELHDSTAQQLVAARLGLNALERRVALTPETQRLLEEVRQAVGTAQREIRNFSYMLHPPSLQEEGLEQTLRAFVMGFARRTGLDVSVQVSRGAWRLPFAVEVALFRVTQEALMNVYRHASAQSAVVRLKRQAGQVVLEVEDDGVGLPKDPADQRAGVGISGMKARMIQLGGTFELTPCAVGLKVRASVAAAQPEL